MNERFEQFTSLVMETARAMQRIKDIEMKKLGLRASHTLCLYYLGTYKNGLTSSELTDYCKEDKAAVSRTLADLIKRNLVKSLSQGKKVYRIKHVLTQKGQEIYKELSKSIERVFTKCSKGLSKEQIASFYRCLNEILSNLITYEKAAV